MKKKTKKVAKPRPVPLKVEAVASLSSSGHNVNVQCKEQLIEMAKKLKQPLFYEIDDDRTLFFVYQGVLFWRELEEDEEKELDYDEWEEEDD